MSSSLHISVLKEESIDCLNIQPDGVYVDATFGRGGHSRAILERLGNNGRLYALDRDPSAQAYAQTIDDSRFHFARCAFSHLSQAFADLQDESVDGVLFDLGVSSPQLDDGMRGFSFMREGPIDMRMDPESGMSAKEWLMQTDERTLATAIRDLGGEPHGISQRLARVIMESRDRLHTTLDLANVIAQAMPKKHYKAGQNPATQTFQAIRMVVNNEVEEIKQGLQAATAMLKKNGVLAVITFHGLEDRLVKQFMRAQEGQRLPSEIPLTDSGWRDQVLRLISPVVQPSQKEVQNNPRARSARLRKAIKI